MSTEIAINDILVKSARFLGLADPLTARLPLLEGADIESRRRHVFEKVATALQEASNGATNIEAVVAGVALTDGIIIELFGGYRGLVDALVDSLVSSMVSPLQECSSEDDFVPRLTAFGRRVMDPYSLVQRRNLYRIALTEAIRDVGRGRELYARGPGRVLNSLARFLLESRQAGVLLEGEHHHLASHMLALLNGSSGLHDSFTPEERSESRPSAQVSRVVAQFLAGVEVPRHDAHQPI